MCENPIPAGAGQADIRSTACKMLAATNQVRNYAASGACRRADSGWHMGHLVAMRTRCRRMDPGIYRDCRLDFFQTWFLFSSGNRSGGMVRRFGVCKIHALCFMEENGAHRNFRSKE